ncbi:hypothetical protein ACQKGC_05260 [Allorhizobium pseudoryzae]|uniref:hypothetical protein n=1 Tax=Allorhizobium pseudoryzae TaxID=379684 RepID=UPI003D049C2C
MSSSSIFPATSRRGVLKGILAGAAASAPIAAQAEAPTDAEQLESCLSQIRDILARMHPTVSIHHPHYLSSREDGSYRLSIQGDVQFQPFQGCGVYLVSIDGWPWEYLVREEPVITLSGNHLGWSRYFGRARADDGGWDDFERTLPPNFVRKLGEASL